MQKLSVLGLPWHTDWTALFGRSAPLILEIGFGRGSFLLYLARQFPDANIIGIERSNQSLEAAEKAIEREQLTNVRVIHGEAQTALYHLFEPATLCRVYVNFPDPWFKKAHQHRRLLDEATIDALVNRLEPAGKLFIATDIRAYADLIAERLARTPGLDNLNAAAWALNRPDKIVTKYEAIARRAGRACHYFAYQRNDHPAPSLPTTKEHDMPHMVFKNPLTLDEIRDRFEQQVYREDDDELVIKLPSVYAGRNELLFIMFVKEPTIAQRVAVMLQPHKQGYTLLLHPLGHPRPTTGIHRGVERLGQWLLSLHPDARIVKKSLQTSD